jgi:hypothetical protein
MTDPDRDELVDADTDIDLPSASRGGLRHERPILYYGLVIGIIVVLAVLVDLFVW